MKKRKPKIVALKGKERYQRLLAGEPETAGMKAGLVVLRPGESVGEHTTDAKEEAIVVLEGIAEVRVDDTPLFKAKKNNLIYIPPYTAHDVRNISRRNLKYVYIVKE